MATFRLHGAEVVTKAEYFGRLGEAGGLETANRNAPALAATGGLEGDPGPGVTRFEPVGLGRPLTILIRDVYTGRFPKKTVFGGGDKQMAVVTALKDYAVYAPASRAVNFLERDIGPRTRVNAPAATSAGTNVVAYSPAVLSDQMHFTVEMAFDRFDDGLFNAVSSAFQAAAGIPLLLPARDYLLGAGGLIKMAAGWADALVDGKAAFSITDTLDFNVPGTTPPTADFRVLGDEEHQGLTYDPRRGLLKADGTPYDGDQPYVVISLDGAERKSLETFAPTLATAEQLKQFFAMKDGFETSVEVILDGLRLANDLKYRQEALRLQAVADAQTDATVKAEMQKRVLAISRNILTSELKLG